MAETAEGQTPFDERVALAELERLRRGIAHYRLQRKTVGEQFDPFVSTFRTSPEPTSDLLPAPGESPAPAAPPSSPEPTMDALTARLRGDRSADWSVSIADRAVVAEPTAPSVDIQQRSKTPRVLILVLLVVTLGAAIAWALWNRTTISPSTVANTAAAPAETSPAPPPPSPRPAPAADPAAPAAALPVTAPAAEVTTTRSVWLRVTVDGERVLERQLPADTRIPLTPRATILIRTGDAGAVRLSIAGKDQGVLGRNGEVVTKSFTIPKSPQ